MAYSAGTSFRDSMEIGQAGEQLVRDSFLARGYSVEDLTGDENWQAMDVDFLLTAPDGTTHLADVKTDTESWDTKNILLEVRMHRLRTGQATEGWYTDSAMDLLLYLCAGTGWLYEIDFDCLRRLVNAGLGRFTRFKNPIDPDCIGEGILVPIDALERSPALLHRSKLDTSCLWKYEWRREKPPPF
ncbi:MAG: hypothetical protein IJA20_09775 [Methanocorpusculum sp.]|nr:hypothetical protein [Oscillospiraceae bacterium]MBQ3570944.1 hypothetical protein [Methanocorpusculum sp.]